MDTGDVESLATAYWDTVVVRLLQLTKLLKSGGGGGMYDGYETAGVNALAVTPSFVSVFRCEKDDSAGADSGSSSSSNSNGTAHALNIGSSDGLPHPPLRAL